MPAPLLPSSVLAVIVLYHRAPAESESFSCFVKILKENAELATRFSLVLYDNSPQSQKYEMPVNFPVHYVHDASNGGLAPAYNFALERADAEGREWLLLLDQDTSLTREFMVELVQAAEALHVRSEVGAIVPKLRVQGRIDSPSAHLFDQMRTQFKRTQPAFGFDVVGIQQQRLSAYNSGSTVRVAALRTMGGFPAEFWLDFLDHVVFHALYLSGYRMYVMRAILAHDSSYSDVRSLPAWRLHNILLARSLYVQQNGTWIDQMLYRVWLLRHSRNLRECCKDPRIWKEAVRQAVWFKIGSKDKRLLT